MASRSRSRSITRRAVGIVQSCHPNSANKSSEFLDTKVLVPSNGSETFLLDQSEPNEPLPTYASKRKLSEVGTSALDPRCCFRLITMTQVTDDEEDNAPTPPARMTVGTANTTATSNGAGSKMRPESQHIALHSIVSPPPFIETTSSTGQSEKANKRARLMLKLEEIETREQLLELDNECDG